MSSMNRVPVRLSATATSLLLAVVSAAGELERDGLTAEKLNKLDRAEADALPVLRILPAIGSGMSEQSFYALTENALTDLRYLSALPGGKPSAHLTEAIRSFQRDLGHKDTGVLLLGEWEELFRRVRKLEPMPIYLGAASVVAHGDLVKAKGTWVFDGDDPSNRQAYPIQATTIECNRLSGTCIDATAVISYDDDYAAMLFVDLQTWAVSKWSESEVVAESNQPQCVAYTLSINLPTKRVSAFRRGKGTPGCEGFSSTRQLLRLVDGLTVSQGFFQKRDEEANRFRNPRYNAALGGFVKQ